MTPAELVARVLGGQPGPIAVTGATGWFGAVTLDLLAAALGDRAPELVTAYAGRPRTIEVSGSRWQVRALEDLVLADPAPQTLLHFGYLTRDRVAAMGVDAYVAANVAITAHVLDAIAVHRPVAVVMTSSGAVYGPDGRLAHDVMTNPYGSLKRLDELAVRAAVADVGGTCVIPRVFSVAGPHITKPELYALGSMIGMAQRGGPVEVRARGPVVRSYCGVDEVVSLSLWAALGSRTPRTDLVFDTGGTPVEVGELAHVVADVHGLPAGSVVRTLDANVAPDVYVGNSETMAAMATTAALTLRSTGDLVRQTATWVASRSASFSG